jgi:hypothetical protein
MAKVSKMLREEVDLPVSTETGNMIRGGTLPPTAGNQPTLNFQDRKFARFRGEGSAARHRFHEALTEISNRAGRGQQPASDARLDMGNLITSNIDEGSIQQGEVSDIRPDTRDRVIKDVLAAIPHHVDQLAENNHYVNRAQKLSGNGMSSKNPAEYDRLMGIHNNSKNARENEVTSIRDKIKSGNRAVLIRHLGMMGKNVVVDQTSPNRPTLTVPYRLLNPKQIRTWGSPVYYDDRKTGADALADLGKPYGNAKDLN